MLFKMCSFCAEYFNISFYLGEIQQLKFSDVTFFTLFNSTGDIFRSLDLFEAVFLLWLTFQNLYRGRPLYIRIKSPKIGPSLSTKYPHWLNPPYPCRYTINFVKSEVFLDQKVRTSATEPPHPPVRTGASFMDIGQRLKQWEEWYANIASFQRYLSIILLLFCSCLTVVKLPW